MVQCFKTFSLSHTQKTLCISIYHFYFYSFIYTSTALHDIPSQIQSWKKKKRCQLPSSFQWYLDNSTLWHHLILTHMSRLWPRKGTCIFYSMTVAYGFDVEVERCGFCECFNSLWVFRCLGFWFGNVIYFVLELKKKKRKHYNWLFMKLVFIYLFILC